MPTLPTDSTQRIQVLDILRGVALLGMFVVHFHVHSTDPGGIDEILRTFIWRLVETKSHGTFALLFGAGFAIQLRRAEAQGRPLARRYLRRLAVLAAFGFAAHAFFGYNVLLGYAVWGVPLLLIRSWSTRTLLLIAVLSAASVGLYHLAASRFLIATAGPAGEAATYQAARAEASRVNEALEAAEAQDSYSVVLAARLRHMAWFYRQPFFFMPGATMTLFIVGLLLIRHRVFEQARAHTRLLVGMMIFGVVSWIADNWLLPGSVGLLRDQWLTFTYVGGALLFLSYKPDLIVWLRPVASAGRMALTNYLLQIATLDLIFAGYGIGLGKVRPVIAFPMALACFVIEVVFSTIWLRHFQFGPAEWLWRSLTYGRPQPMALTRLGAPAQG
ncbi:MAG: DUF418 domain-containing protein [Vicinamibacterales bacterium]